MCEQTKVCTKCGAEKPLSEFSAQKSGRYGRRTMCKQCCNSANAKWRAENPEKAKACGAKWRAENPEKVKARNAKWRTENPEKVKARISKWRTENSEKVKAYNVKWQAENRELVSASYAASALRMCVSEVTPELLELKRQQILIRRLNRQLVATIKEKQK